MSQKHGFVDLKSLDQSLIVDIKYASSDNFVGRPLPGYKKNIAYLKEKTAVQVQKIQAELKRRDLSLVIYEAFRPQKTSDFFIAWSRDVSDQKMKARYYPNVDKKAFFDLGYIAEKSTHTRGIAIDVSLVDLSTGHALEMGGHFDFFDEVSHTLNRKIHETHMQNRLLLKTIMEEYGFENWPTEWWHYALCDSDRFDTFYDFNVE